MLQPLEPALTSPQTTNPASASYSPEGLTSLGNLAPGFSPSVHFQQGPATTILLGSQRAWCCRPSQEHQEPAILEQEKPHSYPASMV